MYRCKFDDILDDEDDFLAVVRFWEMKGCRSFESPTSPSSLSFFLDLLRCHLRRTILCEGKMLTKGNILKICKEKLKNCLLQFLVLNTYVLYIIWKFSQKKKNWHETRCDLFFYRNCQSHDTHVKIVVSQWNTWKCQNNKYNHFRIYDTYIHNSLMYQLFALFYIKYMI